MNAFGIGLPFSEELWFPRLTGGDVYSELNTKVGELVYQFAPNEAEDIMLIDREKERIISLYSSTGSYTQNLEEDSQEILGYKMNLSYNPAAAYLSGSSEIRLLCKEPTNRVVFKLNPSLRVTRIDGSQQSLIYFQERNTNNLHVVLNENIRKKKNLPCAFIIVEGLSRIRAVLKCKESRQSREMIQNTLSHLLFFIPIQPNGIHS